VAESQESFHLGENRGRLAGWFSAGRLIARWLIARWLIAGPGSLGRCSLRSKKLPAVKTHGIGRLTDLPVGQTAFAQILKEDP
jgi:hypothetical protein